MSTNPLNPSGEAYLLPSRGRELGSVPPPALLICLCQKAWRAGEGMREALGASCIPFFNVGNGTYSLRCISELRWGRLSLEAQSTFRKA